MKSLKTSLTTTAQLLRSYTLYINHFFDEILNYDVRFQAIHSFSLIIITLFKHLFKPIMWAAQSIQQHFFFYNHNKNNFLK